MCYYYQRDKLSRQFTLPQGGGTWDLDLSHDVIAPREKSRRWSLLPTHQEGASTVGYQLALRRNPLLTLADQIQTVSDDLHSVYSTICQTGCNVQSQLIPYSWDIAVLRYSYCRLAILKCTELSCIVKC